MEALLGATDVSRPRPRWPPCCSDALRYRLGVASRAVAAILGGYMASALVATVLALYLPTSRVEATLTGMLTAFVIYPCVVIWVFAARSARRAWQGMLLPGAVLGLLLAHSYAGGAS